MGVWMDCLLLPRPLFDQIVGHLESPELLQLSAVGQQHSATHDSSHSHSHTHITSANTQQPTQLTTRQRDSPLITHHYAGKQGVSCTGRDAILRRVREGAQRYACLASWMRCGLTRRAIRHMALQEGVRWLVETTLLWCAFLKNHSNFQLSRVCLGWQANNDRCSRCFFCQGALLWETNWMT